MSKEDKIQKALKEIRSRPDNKKCMDCAAALTQYVVMDFGTWVCATCSGLHREFSHKVKSPTMSTFTMDEVKKLDKQGNDVAKVTWRGRWTSSQFLEPSSGDVSKIREFIKLTYKDKRWYSENPNPVNEPPRRSITPPSSRDKIPILPPSSSGHSQPPAPKKETSLINWDDIPNDPIPSSQPPPNAFNPFAPTTQAPPPRNPSNPFAIPESTPAPTNQDTSFVNPFFIPPMQNTQPVNPMLNTMNNPMIQPMNPAFNTMNYPMNNQSFNTMPNTMNTMPNSMYFPVNPTPAPTPAPINFNAYTAPPPSQPKPAQNNDVFDLSFDFPTSKPAQPPQKTQASNNDFLTGFDSLTVKEQPKTQQHDAFDFPALRNNPPPSSTSSNTGNSGISPLQPPPPRSTILKKDDKKPEDSAPSCPICNKKFKASTTNDEINRHVDECLNRGIIDNNGDASPTEVPKSSNPDGEPWKEWFDLSKMEWYYGTIDRQEAEKILMRCTEDSFMVRKSSVKDSYALSLYNHKKRVITHTLIVPKSGGYSFQDNNRIYPSILDLVTKSPECKELKPPPKTRIDLDF